MVTLSAPRGIFPPIRKDASDRQRNTKARRRTCNVLAKRHPERMKRIMEQYSCSTAEARRQLPALYVMEALALFAEWYERFEDDGTPVVVVPEPSVVESSAYADIFGESKAGRPVGAGSYFDHRNKERKVSEKAARRAEAVLRRRHEEELVRLFEAEYEYLMNVEED